MELRLGSRAFGSGDHVIWVTDDHPPAVGIALPDRTGIVEVPPDPGQVARIHRKFGLPVAVDAPASVADECVRAGAAVLMGGRSAEAAARTGAALLCGEPAAALAAGVGAERIIVDAGISPSASAVEELVATGHPVLVTVLSPAPPPHDGPGAGEGQDRSPSDPALLATASVYAWLGVRIFRARPRDVPALGQVLDMVASIQGTRPPTLTRRGLT